MTYINQRTNVVTLLGNPEIATLNENEMNSVVDALQANGAFVENVDWLAPERAVDIFVNGMELGEIRELLHHLLANAPFDAVAQQNHNRRKKLLISDMDSTMIEQECIDELADFAGLKEKVSAITERAMNGEIEFMDALRERVLLLKGLSADVLQQAFDKHITFMPGAKELVATMRANGARCILVSGGFTFFTERVANILGFHDQEANILEMEDGKLSGLVREPILNRTAKMRALEFHINDLNVPMSASLVVGDGANDLDMICASAEKNGLGVAYRAKPTVQQAALQTGGAVIKTCDLTALLYTQGYRQEDVKTA